jgi:hypothetical protein
MPDSAKLSKNCHQSISVRALLLPGLTLGFLRKFLISIGTAPLCLGFLGIAIGVLGFLLMVGGVIFAVTPTRGAVATSPIGAKPRAARASNSSFMDRMN